MTKRLTGTTATRMGLPTTDRGNAQSHERANGLDPHVLMVWSGKADAALLSFQKRHRMKLGWKDIYNWDELNLDMGRFAESNNAVYIKDGSRCITVTMTALTLGSSPFANDLTKAR